MKKILILSAALLTGFFALSCGDSSSEPEDDPNMPAVKIEVGDIADNKATVTAALEKGNFYGAKIGVLGLNGAGKSSLLKILAGVDEAFDGKTVLAPGYTIGYLEQEPLVNEMLTVREVVEEGAQELVNLVKEFEEIIGNRIKEQIDVEYVFQELDDLPEGFE